MKHRKPGVQMTNDERLVMLETTVTHIHETLERLDKRFDSIDQNLNNTRKELKDEIKSIDNRMWILFILLLGIIGTLWATFGHAFHWY